jgi:hypothetical protein
MPGSTASRPTRGPQNGLGDTGPFGSEATGSGLAQPAKYDSHVDSGLPSRLRRVIPRVDDVAELVERRVERSSVRPTRVVGLGELFAGRGAPGPEQSLCLVGEQQISQPLDCGGRREARWLVRCRSDEMTELLRCTLDLGVDRRAPFSVVSAARFGQQIAHNERLLQRGTGNVLPNRSRSAR